MSSLFRLRHFHLAQRLCAAFRLPRLHRFRSARSYRSFHEQTAIEAGDDNDGGCPIVFNASDCAAESYYPESCERVKTTQGPEIERADCYLTIVRWTTNNPGGSPEHYAVVHYGKNPKDLSQTAKSPIRLNPNHPDTVFRVRIEGLQPKTTYYYVVDSMEADGKSDGVKSAVNEFTTK